MKNILKIILITILMSSTVRCLAEESMIPEINLGVTIIQTCKGEKELNRATGFFFRYKDKKFLVTNRHVVTSADKNYIPDYINILLHANRSDLKSNRVVRVNLHEEGNPIWMDHPRYSDIKCDVVLIPLNHETMDKVNYYLFNTSSIEFFNEAQLNIPEIHSFANVVVVGYPLGFYDSINNLPVYRKAMIASAYPVKFMNKPYFLIDSNLHPGTSGSPVVNSHHTLFKEGKDKEGYKLFGIHSAEHTMRGEPLGLNVVWYSSLLAEIAEQ